uniref:Sugar phosphate transporter domain-containing protein n=1 Tax=Hyaloperonospora arabidopsidis (strain Emoy2) TaxID=559515 RepID=M4BBW0_HYAAE
MDVPQTLRARPCTHSSSESLVIDCSPVPVSGCLEDDEEIATTTETSQLLDEKNDDTSSNSKLKLKNKNKLPDVELKPENGLELLNTKEKGEAGEENKAKLSYVSPSVVVFWLAMWFLQNIGVTFWNKKALSALQLPVTLTFVHMMCNTLGAFLFIYVYKGIDRKPLKPGQTQLMVSFSFIFVSNIITGNWSLGLVSISLNQVMRALVPSVVIVLSMLILGKTYTLERKLSLVPVAFGVYLACTGDNSCTVIGFIITAVAVLFAGLKAVLSNKAPLSACWCLVAMFLSGEVDTIMNNWEAVLSASFWYILTGIISFMLNVTSFMANKVTSAVTLCVCGNMKQVVVIVMSILINNDVITAQKAIGIVVVTIGGSAYAYISTKETIGQATVSAPAKPKLQMQTV